jgi:inorganic pyrophosphatase
MEALHKLPALNKRGDLVCIVESPRNAKAKFKYDPVHQVFMLSRSLIAGVHYPYDWGFIPSTRAEDGDPLDVMLFHDTATMPGVVVLARPIGALLVTQKKADGSGRETNHRLFAVPLGSERAQSWQDARELPERMRQELESFFIAAGALAGKELEIREWVGPRAARTLVDEAVARLKASPDDFADGLERE